MNKKKILISVKRLSCESYLVLIEYSKQCNEIHIDSETIILNEVIEIGYSLNIAQYISAIIKVKIEAQKKALNRALI